MAFEITVDDIASRLPVELDEAQLPRVAQLIVDAVALIEERFARAGRDFHSELVSVAWLDNAARRVVREMVSAAVMIGGNAGVRSVASTTGPQSDSITYADGIDWVSFGGVRLTDSQAEELALVVGVRASWRAPRAIRWPEVRHRG